VPTPLAPPQGSGAARSSQSNQLPPVAGFYTGKPYLAESGSYAFKYREYNPEMNRWTTVDPSGFPDGANQFIYACNLPVGGFDPDGLSFLCYVTGSLVEWSGSGKKSDGSIDWGQKTGSQWGAVSGGASGKPSIEQGWWSVGSRTANLGTPDDVSQGGEISESDWQTSDGTWHEGSMSVWKNGDRTQGHTQYKYTLNPLDGQNGSGIKLHPDGPEFGVTHGCIGMSGYNNAVSIDSYLQSHSGIKIFVE